MTSASRHARAICIGELALDLIRVPGPPNDPPVFESHAGGSALNVAAGLRSGGIPAAVCSRVGCDPAGRLILDTLNVLRVATDLIEEDPTRPSRILFIDHGDPERPVRIQTPESADLYINAGTIAEIEQDDCSLLYVSGAAFLGESSAEAVFALAQVMSASDGCLIAFDPNIAPSPGPSGDVIREKMARLLPHVHVIQVTADRLARYFPDRSVEELTRSIPLVIHTRGALGAELRAGEDAILLDAPQGPVVDPTGAGDAFLASILSSLVQESGFPRHRRLQPDLLRSFGIEATRAAARVLGVRGAATSYYGARDDSRIET